MEPFEILVKSVQDYVRRCLTPIGERLKGAEERIEALDSRLAKAQQQLSSVQKELAALSRREPGK